MDVVQIKSDFFVFLYFHQQEMYLCCLMLFFLQNSEGYMGLISFVCGLGSKGLSHALGSNLVKVCVIKV